MVRDVLPPGLATLLLTDLLQRSGRYERGQWFMFGQRHDAPRTSAYFNLREAEVRGLLRKAGSLYGRYGAACSPVPMRSPTCCHLRTAAPAFFLTYLCCRRAGQPIRTRGCWCVRGRSRGRGADP